MLEQKGQFLNWKPKQGVTLSLMEAKIHLNKKDDPNMCACRLIAERKRQVTQVEYYSRKSNKVKKITHVILSSAQSHVIWSMRIFFGVAIYSLQDLKGFADGPLHGLCDSKVDILSQQPKLGAKTFSVNVKATTLI